MMKVLLSTVLFLLTSLSHPASGFTVASTGQQRMLSSIPVAFTPRSTNQKSVLYMSDSSDVQAGTVKWFNTVKGFGFITPEDGGDDIFVHQTAIKAEGFRSLADGEEVEFQVQLDATGRKKATNVTGPKGAAVKGAPFRPQSDYGTY